MYTSGPKNLVFDPIFIFSANLKRVVVHEAIYFWNFKATGYVCNPILVQMPEFVSTQSSEN